MKKTLFTLFLVFMVSFYAMSQTPQYYNSNSGTSSNSFPFNVAAGKAINSLYLAGEFALPSPCPTGKQITTVYFRTSTAATKTYTNLHILLAQDSTITTFTSGVFYAGPYDTVYFQDTTTLTSTVGGWMAVTLKHPYVYNPGKALILFVGHCGTTGSGQSVYNSSASGIRRVWSVGGCPFVAYAGGDGSWLNFGIDVVDATPTAQLPDLIYYRFENNPSPLLTPNFAIPGVGTNPAPITTLTLTSGGQFDSCLSGTATASAKINTGYSLSTGTSSFTISMWLNNLPTPATTRYLFGDLGLSFRCFVGGVAPTGGAVLRGTGVTDVPINGIFPGPNVIHIVYDSAASNVKIYKNGVLDNTVSQTPFNFTAGTGFSVGGYSTSAGLEGIMDEFRFYKRALNQAEITATWNIELGTLTGIIPKISDVPKNYALSQNYPNPFNPVTKINYSLPKAGLVMLKVYNILGQEVATLVNEVKTAGNYFVDFDATNFASGVYFYTINSGNFTATKRMTFVK